uniref:Uncharacterized protein n=1 Tax=Arundo donax TaxID=35708 RepID=A0A0A9A4S5_ARUDO
MSCACQRKKKEKQEKWATSSFEPLS